MASPLVFKIHNSTNAMMAAARHAEDAAMIVAGLGNGTTIKWEGSIVWKEGSEATSAGLSYDDTAAIIINRVAQINRRHYAQKYVG